MSTDVRRVIFLKYSGPIVQNTFREAVNPWGEGSGIYKISRLDQYLERLDEGQKDYIDRKLQKYKDRFGSDEIERYDKVYKPIIDQGYLPEEAKLQQLGFRDMDQLETLLANFLLRLSRSLMPEDFESEQMPPLGV